MANCDIADAVVLAATTIAVETVRVRPTEQECKGMSDLITAGIVQSFADNTNRHESLRRYFNLYLTPARAVEVVGATRTLLASQEFMVHAQKTDFRIRPVLVAGAISHVPEKDAYLFMDEMFPDTAKVCRLRKLWSSLTR